MIIGMISTVLNQYEGKSFNEFINAFRLKEVQTRLLDPTYDHLTVTGITFDCGFNSQASFQRTFKSTMNLSPSAFRSANQKRTLNTSQI